jgi:hypothetical protein
MLPAARWRPRLVPLKPKQCWNQAGAAFNTIVLDHPDRMNDHGNGARNAKTVSGFVPESQARFIQVGGVTE